MPKSMSIGDGERFDVVALWIVKVRVYSDRVTGDVDNSVSIVVAFGPKEWRTDVRRMHMRD